MTDGGARFCNLPTLLLTARLVRRGGCPRPPDTAAQGPTAGSPRGRPTQPRLRQPTAAEPAAPSGRCPFWHSALTGGSRHAQQRPPALLEPALPSTSGGSVTTAVAPGPAPASASHRPVPGVVPSGLSRRPALLYCTATMAGASHPRQSQHARWHSSERGYQGTPKPEPSP
jgi:hypothetical protein